MINIKYYLNRFILVLLWFVLSLATILIGGLFLLDLISHIMGSSLPFPVHRNDIINIIIVFLIYILTWIAWRKITYTRRDFLRLSQNIGIKFVTSEFLPKWFNDLSHFYLTGYFNDTSVVSMIDHPFMSFLVFMNKGSGGPMIRYQDLEKQLFHSFQKETPASESDQDNTSLQPSGLFKHIDLGKVFSMECLYEESRIELFSLIHGPFNIDIKIQIENNEINIPSTDCKEIDTTLSTSLNDIKHFYARLIVNKDCLRMTIIGGSSEGDRFKQKIIKGFEVFQTMNNKLKKKYPVGNWDSWDVKWDKKGDFFYLSQK